ncbi:WhiB family transcriptional regulator [Jiangella asiatica]|uniref:Transcriptional regulator WhiB n=1 Tax=Jiangella asiatica TaxID=2530372 RepID=A0A4R5DB82_9ACTN|nr:WhiB family transcriptional regulator [Jiangella asiatica]TDE09250.1 WhiB family transcriptional regulator [Jiangella asiatica]
MTAEHAAGAWFVRGACRDAEPDLFFPLGASEHSLAQVEAAAAVCAGCPVTEECLTWALETGQDHGIWGGTTPEERRMMRRALSRR